MQKFVDIVGRLYVLMFSERPPGSSWPILFSEIHIGLGPDYPCQKEYTDTPIDKRQTAIWNPLAAILYPAQGTALKVVSEHPWNQQARIIISALSTGTDFCSQNYVFNKLVFVDVQYSKNFVRVPFISSDCKTFFISMPCRKCLVFYKIYK